MTMFNSTKRNSDPKPWAFVDKHAFVIERTVAPRTASEFLPRPEFDNNPNRILLAFREAVETSHLDAAREARWWLGVGLLDFANLNDIGAESPEFIHARKVLQRLAAL